MDRLVIEEPGQITIVVPLDGDPVLAIGLSVNQNLNDAAAVRTPVHVVAYENDLCVCSAIRFDQVQNTQQFVALTVNVADGINGVWQIFSRKFTQ